MSGAKETPRQKMIGMMYLVLTALLALNISTEVLNGFVKVENSLLQTQATLSDKIHDTYTAFDQKYASDTKKVGPFYDVALDIRKKSDSLILYITELKARCLSKSEGDYDVQENLKFEDYFFEDENGNYTTKKLNDIDRKDEYQNLTALMVGADPNNPKTGEWTANGIKLAIQKYRDYLLNIQVTDIEGEIQKIPPSMIKSLTERFSFEKEMSDEKMVLWEVANFYNMPLAAVVPLMSKMVIDIQDAQEDAIGWLLNSTEAKSLKFTDVMAMAIPQSNFVRRGDTARANIILTAFDKTKRPEIYIDPIKWDGVDTTPLDYLGLGLPLALDSSGQGLMSISTSGMSLGKYQYRGLIRYQGADGDMESTPFTTPTFTVAEPELVVSPTKMNVFYRGVGNPVEISVPGFSSDKLTARISGNHKIKSQTDGSFIVTPSNDRNNEAIITVTGVMPDGSISNLGSKPFVVKRIRDPNPKWCFKTDKDNEISVTDIRSFTGVSAQMDKDFLFQVKPVVKGFKITMVKDGIASTAESNSRNMTPEQKELVGKARGGTRILIEDIKVQMPDRTTRILKMMLKVTR